MSETVFNTDIQPSVVAVAFAGNPNRQTIVAVIRVEDDGTYLVGEPINPEYHWAVRYCGPAENLFGGLFSYWVDEHELSKWSSPIYGPEEYTPHCAGSCCNS